MTACARQTGFTGLAPFADALAWIDAQAVRLPAEAIPVRDACRRVLAQPLTAATDWPDMDRAAIDGCAVSATDTEGASDYNPLLLDVAVPVLSGTAMPDGTDAVIAPPAIGGNGPVRHVLAAVARGAGVERRGSDASAGFQFSPVALQPESVAMLELLGVATVTVTRQPRVALVVAGSKYGPDVLTPMLRALIGRDGGLAWHHTDSMSLSSGGADLLLLVGRTGLGRDDDMAARLLAAGGALDLHGIAVRPGQSAGLGSLDGTPAMLLPGTPMAALSVYELLAGPAIRRMGGRILPWLQAARPVVLGRKITSTVGVTDMIRVQVVADRAMPLGPADTGGLGRAILGDGWVIVPDGHEGYPAGATVMVHSPGGAGA